MAPQHTRTLGSEDELESGGCVGWNGLGSSLRQLQQPPSKTRTRSPEEGQLGEHDVRPRGVVLLRNPRRLRRQPREREPRARPTRAASLPRVPHVAIVDHHSQEPARQRARSEGAALLRRP